MKTDDIIIDFFDTPYTGLDGVPRTTRLGLGRNMTLWIEWEELGIRIEDGRQMMREYPGQVLLIDEENDRLFVNADAVARIIRQPKLRSDWIENNRRILNQYKNIRASYDAT